MNRRKQVDVFLIACFMFFSLYNLNCGRFENVIIFPFLFWLYFVNIWHDAGHFALLSNKYYEFLFFLFYFPISKPKGWYYRHNFLHHSYSNVLYIDRDIGGVITQSYKKKLNKISKKCKNFNNSQTSKKSLNRDREENNPSHRSENMFRK